MLVFHPTSIWQLERTEAWLRQKQQRGLQLRRMFGPLYQFTQETKDRSAGYWIEFYDTGSRSGTASLFLERFHAEEVSTALSSYSIYRYTPTAQREEELIQWRRDRYRHARVAMLQRLICTVLLAGVLVLRYQSFLSGVLGALCLLVLLLYIIYNIIGLAQVQPRITE